MTYWFSTQQLVNNYPLSLNTFLFCFLVFAVRDCTSHFASTILFPCHEQHENNQRHSLNNCWSCVKLWFLVVFNTPSSCPSDLSITSGIRLYLEIRATHAQFYSASSWITFCTLKCLVA